ncbi:MAG TPA: hypothetical protein V6D50_13830 [Chroococcales cyanobacterium]
MSEADTPNNQPLPEPTTSMDDSSADLPEVTQTPEEPQVVNVTQLPSFLEVVRPLRQEPTTEVEESPLTETEPITIEAETSATEIPVVSEQRTKDADWFALTQKMRQRNRHLLDQVAQLKAALREKDEELHAEQMRSRAREALMAQQMEELKTGQERLTRLFQALEASHQAAQRQQILIETLSEQLQSSQERIAQLERECALTQQRYNEQSHQLLQAANTCRELRTRLHRQQQQTLQFKTALEKSLEMTPPTASQATPQSRTTAPTTFPKTQPIQPWSVDLEIPEDTISDPLWNRPIQIDPLLKVYASQGEPLEITSIERIEQLATVDSSEPLDEVITAVPESTDTELESEQQLLDEITSLAEASGLLEVQPDVAGVPGQLRLVPSTSLEETDNPAIPLGNVEETPWLEESEELEAQVERLDEDEEVEEDFAETEPEEQKDVRLPQSNWPSPTLYPLRRPKKLRSLAAIDLPSFPRYRPV